AGPCGIELIENSSEDGSSTLSSI
ncbi:hypothetical protein Tco_0036874, partial [Tanacetum coccineum]